MNCWESIRLVAVVVLVAPAGCDQEEAAMTDSAWQDLITLLDGMGYWEGLPADEKAAGFETIVREGNLLMLDHPRFFSGDDESLAEFGIAEFLDENRDRIHEFGGVFETVEDLQSDDYSYSVSVDGRMYEVYTALHLQAEERGEWNIWRRAARTTQTILNDCFVRGGSDTRAYWFSGGNDAFVWFLTPDMAAAIRDSGLFSPDECPAIID